MSEETNGQYQFAEISAMSTTLLPQSHYVVKPRGRVAHEYETIAQAATAMTKLAPTPTAMSIVTGRRSRSLTASELREPARGSALTGCSGAAVARRRSW
jgi:hypothetical protein